MIGFLCCWWLAQTPSCLCENPELWSLTPFRVDDRDRLVSLHAGDTLHPVFLFVGNKRKKYSGGKEAFESEKQTRQKKRRGRKPGIETGTKSNRWRKKSKAKRDKISRKKKSANEMYLVRGVKVESPMVTDGVRSNGDDAARFREKRTLVSWNNALYKEAEVWFVTRF